MALVKIISGPSKYDLMLALFDATSDRIRPVVFGQEDEGEQITVRVHSVERNNYTDESWNIFGYAYHKGNCRLVNICFSTITRQGHMRLDPMD